MRLRQGAGGAGDGVLDDLASVEPLLRASCTHELAASRPLADVVADLIAIAEPAD